MAHISNRELAPGSTIPTASMADISFLLLIFFIVSTVFIRYRPEVSATLPQAESVELMKNQRNLSTLWISADGIIQVDSALVNMDGVAPILHSKLRNNPHLIVLIKADEQARYGTVSEVVEQLRRANALRIAFAARTQAIGPGR